MKKVLGKLLLITALVFFATLFSRMTVEASSDNVSSFLEFEEAVIELNNKKQTTALANSVDNEQYSEFSLKRLIVNGKLKNTYGAVNVISYNELHILCYSSEKNTYDAYNELIKDSTIDVVIDKKYKVESYAETTYDYSSYTNWAAESVDIGGYRQYLVDNNVRKEVVVVVLDTGINTSHSMFANRLLKNASGKVKGYSYYNSKYRYSYNNLAFDSDDSKKYSFEDDHSHGTHVAGIIASLTPENVKILPIKISDDSGYSSNSIFMAAYLRVIEIYSKQYNVVATNLSFSGGGKDGVAEKNTFNEKCYDPLIALNILPITAAGNESYRNNIEGLNAIVVSALKESGNEYVFDNSYSNYGKIVDISAPGTAILSAGIASSDRSDSSLVYKNGTSMAAPQVAGVVALLYLNPNLPSNFTALDIQEALYENALDMGTPDKDIYYGEGMLNLKYFEVPNIADLLFYKNDVLITGYVNNENFENMFLLKIKSSNPEFQIMYTIDKTIPEFSDNSNLYNVNLNVNNTITIYAMGVKVVNGKIVARTDLYRISYFLSNTALEDSFTVDNRGYLVTYTGNYTNLVIPSVLHGKTIKGINPSLFKDSNLESIVLPDTLENIGGYAFQDSKNLKYIYAPGVKKIYIAAFSGCESLKLISDKTPTSADVEGAYFPSLTETIGFTFNNCINLESVSLSKLTTLGEEGYDFQACEKLNYVYLPLITSIPNGTFNQCIGLNGEFIIGEFVQTIGSRAFKGTNIMYFSVHKGNRNFYSDGFGIYDENSLIVVATPSESALYDYEILQSVSIDGKSYTITTISESVLSDKTFGKITIPASITLIDKWAFNNSTIGTLYYNATNCSAEGYWDQEEFGRYPPFYRIDTIIIGENVVNVPERLFQDVFFDTLIINSSSTTFSSASFYRFEEQGYLEKLIFNFTTVITKSYLEMVLYTADLASSRSGVNSIYVKTEIGEEALTLIKDLKYKYVEDGYIVYTRTKIISNYKITVDINNESYGVVAPSDDLYYEEGTSATYTFTPNEGYHISKILIDDEKLTSEEISNVLKNGYTFENLDSHHSIYVEFEPNIYRIIYMDDEGNEIFDLSPSSYEYRTAVTLPPYAQKEGYNFMGWYNNPEYLGERFITTSTLDIGDLIFYAKFEIKTYMINVIQVGNGTISSAKDSYVHGETADFIITANEGYHVEYLLIDDEKYTFTLNEYRFKNITKNHTISAKFSPNTDTPYTVKFWKQSLVSENSTLIGEKYYTLLEVDSTKKGTTDEKTNVSVTSIEGFAEFIEQKVIKSDGSTVVDVLYNRKSYSLTLHKDLGIEKVNGAGTYLFGETVQISAVEAYGYIWSKWLSSNISIIPSSTTNRYTFTMPAHSIILTATSEIKQCIITVMPVSNGSVNPSNYQIVDCGADFDIVMTPDFGYSLSVILIDGVDVTSQVVNGKYTMKNIDDSKVVSVKFSLSKYIITATSGENGAINPAGKSSVTHGEDKTFEFKPDDGYRVASIKVDNILLSQDELKAAIKDGYTFKQVKKNHSIQVTFEENLFNVKIETVGNGTVETENNLTGISAGSNISLTVTPDEGNQIYKVTINDVNGTVKNNVLEILDIQSDINIKVVFSKIEQSSKGDGGKKSGGLSCSKRAEGNNGIGDLLLVAVTLLYFAFPKKRIFK